MTMTEEPYDFRKVQHATKLGGSPCKRTFLSGRSPIFLAIHLDYNLASPVGARKPRGARAPASWHRKPTNAAHAIPSTGQRPRRQQQKPTPALNAVQARLTSRKERKTTHCSYDEPDQDIRIPIKNARRNHPRSQLTRSFLISSDVERRDHGATTARPSRLKKDRNRSQKTTPRFRNRTAHTEAGRPQTKFTLAPTAGPLQSCAGISF